MKTLKRKALDKNPDEFYFKMVRTRLEVSSTATLLLAGGHISNLATSYKDHN